MNRRRRPAPQLTDEALRTMLLVRGRRADAAGLLGAVRRQAAATAQRRRLAVVLGRSSRLLTRPTVALATVAVVVMSGGALLFGDGRHPTPKQQGLGPQGSSAPATDVAGSSPMTAGPVHPLTVDQVSRWIAADRRSLAGRELVVAGSLEMQRTWCQAQPTCTAVHLVGLQPDLPIQPVADLGDRNWPGLGRPIVGTFAMAYVAGALQYQGTISVAPDGGPWSPETMPHGVPGRPQATDYVLVHGLPLGDAPAIACPRPGACDDPRGTYLVSWKAQACPAASGTIADCYVPPRAWQWGIDYVLAPWPEASRSAPPAAPAPSPSALGGVASAFVAGGVAWQPAVGAPAQAYTAALGRVDGSWLRFARDPLGQHTVVERSPDGVAWTTVPTGSAFAGLDVDHGDWVLGTAERQGTIVAVGASVLFDGSSGDATAWWSTDGKAWHRATVPGGADAEIAAVAAGATGFVAVGSDGYPGGNTQLPGARGAAVWTSADGRAWTRVPPQDGFAGGIMRSVVFDGSRYVGGGERIPRAGAGMPEPPIWTSADGRHWSRTARGSLPAVFDLVRLAVAPGGVFALAGSLDGSAAALYRSEGQGAWTPVALPSVPPPPGLGPSAMYLRDVAAAGGRWVLVGLQTPPGGDAADQLVVWTSADGQAWQPVTPDRPELARVDVQQLVTGPTAVLALGAADDPTALTPQALSWRLTP